MSTKTAEPKSIDPSPGATGDKLSKGDIVSYGMGGVSNTLQTQFKAQFFMVFLSDVAAIPIALVGAWTMVLTIWDAVIDPFLGNFIDRTNTRWGKYRPHMMFGGICLAITTIAMFCVPNFSTNGKLIYYIVLMLLWALFCSQQNIAWQSLNSVMSGDDHQRQLLLTSRQMGGFIAGAAAGAVTLPIVGFFGSGSHGWLVVAALVSVVALVSIFIAAHGARKRDYKDAIPAPKDDVSMLRHMGIIAKNRAVLCAAFLFGLVTLSQTVTQTVNIYYLRLVVNNLGVLSICSVIGMFSSMLFFPMMPALLKRLGKLKMLLLGISIQLTAPVFTLIFREALTPIQVIVLTSVSGVGFIFANMSSLSLVPDCVDYTELKYGVRQAAFINAVISFIRQFCTSFSTFIVGSLLALVGYTATSKATPELTNMIINIRGLVPLALFVVLLVIIKLYPISTKYGAEMREQLRLKREAEEAEMTTV